jgi:hypothetical protein
LYWKILNDTIFSVRDYSTVIPKYHVDFQEKAILSYEREGKDLYEVIQYTNRPEVAERTAVSVRYIHEDDNYVRFLFVYQQRVHYARYNKTTQVTDTYCFDGSLLNVKLEYFMDMKGDSLVLSASNKENDDENPMLLVINEKDIW